MSAPASADFCYQVPKHSRDIVIRDGLVDPTSLLPYMDGCHCEHLIDSPKEPGSHKEEGHHIIFTEKKVKRARSNWLTWARNSKYNIVQMLQCQEDLFHQASAEEVPLDEIDIEATRYFLEEAELLTRYAASSFLLTEYKNRLEDDYRRNRAEVSQLAARLAITAEMNEEDKTRVRGIQVMEFAVVTGALLNYVNQRTEEGMETLVRERMTHNSAVIPTEIYNDGALETIAGTRLNDRIKTSSFGVRKALLPQAT